MGKLSGFDFLEAFEELITVTGDTLAGFFDDGQGILFAFGGNDKFGV